MGVLNVPLIFYKIFINATKISGGIMKTIKICPECETHLYLMWSAFNDGTTDCGSCGSNFEEDELKEVDREEII